MQIFRFSKLITLALAFSALLPKMESQIRPPISLPPRTPPPLCASQFALANYACAMLPVTPGSPPSPSKPQPPSPGPPPPDDDGGDDDHKLRHRHRHGHGYRRKHRHSRPPTLQEDNCCRWAREVDSQCVCEVLIRLPPFLTKPAHQYIVKIGDSCNVTYSCGGPI